MGQTVFLLWLLSGKVKMTENLQSSLGIFREGRKLENKMVLVFLEEPLGFRKMIPGTSQQGRKQMVTS